MERSMSSTPSWAWCERKGSTQRSMGWPRNSRSELFVVGSALADPSPGGPFHNAITGEHIARLETRSMHSKPS